MPCDTLKLGMRRNDSGGVIHRALTRLPLKMGKKRFERGL
jgi:hypothetical protein